MRKPPIARKINPKNFAKVKEDANKLGVSGAAKRWKVCYATVYYILHPHKRTEKLRKEREYRLAHPKLTQQSNIKGQRKYKRSHPERVLLNNARHSAKKNNLPFNLVESDIHIPEKCPILGIPLQVQKGNVGNASPTIDKVIPARGYVRGNINVISHRANTLKNNETDPRVFDAIANYIRSNQ